MATLREARATAVPTGSENLKDEDFVEEISTLVLSYLSPNGASHPERTQDPRT
jgi:hypothetical protein